MQTIQLKSEVTLSLGDVLKGMEKLSVEEMDAFMKKLLAIRAKKIAPSLSAKETDLFQQINATLPDETFHRYDKLDEKREMGTLSEKEHRELMDIIDQLEELDLKRAEGLAELSKIRGVPFKTLVQQLGIQPRQSNA